MTTFKRCNLCSTVNRTIVRTCRGCGNRPAWTKLAAIENAQHVVSIKADRARTMALAHSLCGQL